MGALAFFDRCGAAFSFLAETSSFEASSFWAPAAPVPLSSTSSSLFCRLCSSPGVRKLTGVLG